MLLAVSAAQLLFSYSCASLLLPYFYNSPRSRECFPLPGTVEEQPLSRCSQLEGKWFSYPPSPSQLASPQAGWIWLYRAVSSLPFHTALSPLPDFPAINGSGLFQPHHPPDTKRCCGKPKLGQASSELGKQAIQQLGFCRFSGSIVPGFGDLSALR